MCDFIWLYKEVADRGNSMQWKTPASWEKGICASVFADIFVYC